MTVRLVDHVVMMHIAVVLVMQFALNLQLAIWHAHIDLWLSYQLLVVHVQECQGILDKACTCNVCSRICILCWQPLTKRK